MHIHSLLWFVLLVILAFRLYGSIFASSTMTGLAVLLFALDDIHAGAGRISSRHALVSMVFGLLSLQLYVQGNLRKDRLRIAGSWLAFIAALLASEMGLVVLAYLLAYALFLDRRNLLSRIKQLLPFVIIVILWHILYTALGYGVAGSILYIDPVRFPLENLQALLVRFPLLVFSAIGLPVADMVFMLSPQGLIFVSVLAAVFAGLVVLLTYPLLRKDPVGVFWGAGLLFSIVHLCAGPPDWEGATVSLAVQPTS